MEKLKPCPFCGEAVKLYTQLSKDGTVKWGIIMHGPAIPCGVQLMADFNGVVAIWNKRIQENTKK